MQPGGRPCPTSCSSSGAVVVQPGLEGTDGRRYVAELVAEPDPPRPDPETTLRLAFVEAESGEPLPVGVDLAGGLPDRLEALCYPPSGGIVVAQLRRSQPGLYEGRARLWWPGRWEVQVAALPIGDRSVTFVAGILQVVER